MIRGWLHTCGSKIVDSHHHVVRPISIGMWEMARDPAVGSSVFLTFVTDSMGFFIFLGLATIILL